MAVTHEEVTAQGNEDNEREETVAQSPRHRRRAFVVGGVMAAAVMGGVGGVVAATSSHGSEAYSLSADACSNLGSKTFAPANNGNWILYPNTNCNVQGEGGIPAESGVLLEGTWVPPQQFNQRMTVVVENDALAAKYTQEQEESCDGGYSCTTWWYGGFDTQNAHYGSVEKGTLVTPDGTFPDEVSTNPKAAGAGENSYIVQVPTSNGEKLDVIIGIGFANPSASYEQVAANAVAAVLAPAS